MKKMETIRRIKIIDVLKREDYGSEVNVKGWVRTRRGSKSVHFIALNDGSTINNVQVVADADKFDDELIKLITTGACLSVTGELVQSVGSGQAVEIQARAIEVLGTCGSDYPMQKKGQSMEYMPYACPHAFAYQYVRCGVPYPSSHGDGHPSLFP